MYQKLNWLFMIFWFAGIIAMSVFQQLWLMKYMVSAFLVFWIWGFFRTFRYQLMKRKSSQNTVQNESAAQSTPTTPKEERLDRTFGKEKKSIFDGIFNRQDDRFKR